MTNNKLKNIANLDFTQIADSFAKSSKPIVFIFSCGYEKRSLAQFKYLLNSCKQERINYLCISYSSYKTSGSRQENEKFLADHGISPIELEPGGAEKVWNVINEYLSETFGQGAQIYIDYSSMPRNWYCMFAQKLLTGELGENASLIYSHGKYFETQYPCVGYGEFHKFSGRPKITSTREVNIFGLGFDSIRTHGIWTFLDPELTVAVIARSPSNAEHCRRVRSENHEILSASHSIYEVDVDNFCSTLSTLVDLSRRFQNFGDVALVPDGPKPLVLAMSLVPLYLEGKGCYCWHVGHVKPDDYEPIDVESSGEYFGFGAF